MIDKIYGIVGHFSQEPFQDSSFGGYFRVYSNNAIKGRLVDVCSSKIEGDMVDDVLQFTKIYDSRTIVRQIANSCSVLLRFGEVEYSYRKTGNYTGTFKQRKK